MSFNGMIIFYIHRSFLSTYILDEYSRVSILANNTLARIIYATY